IVYRGDRRAAGEGGGTVPPARRGHRRYRPLCGRTAPAERHRRRHRRNAVAEIPACECRRRPALDARLGARRISGRRELGRAYASRGARARALTRTEPPRRAPPRTHRDLTNAMIAATTGPSLRKKPCAPRALQGLSLGSPAVLIHRTRALPCDQATNCCAPLGSVNLQTSRL